MEKFVTKIAQHIAESETPLADWQVILPSQRAKLYLQKALFDVYKKPIFSPKIRTINRWIQDLTPQVIQNKSRLILDLYEIHAEKENSKNAAVFDEFLNWSSMLLADFDEIDRYLIDSKTIFRNLKDIKEIESWSFNSEDLTESQLKFLEFWDRLPGYYEKFNARLTKKGALYAGKAYRQVAENIDLVFKENPKARFLFAGFNALSPAEISIMKQLHRMGRADILIDADHYYMDDTSHEAGAFLRHFCSEIGLKNPAFIGNKLAGDPKEIEFIACSQATGQAKVIGNLLNDLNPKEYAETLVLLADESLIVPLLQHIPAQVRKANITLGLPLRNTPLRTWIDLIFHIQESFSIRNQKAAYHKDLFQFWNHPFLIAIFTEEESKAIYKLESEIRKRNIIFQNPSKIEVPERIRTLLQLLYTDWKSDWKMALANMRSFNRLLHDQFPESAEFETAVIQRFDEAIIDFENCVSEGLPEMSIRSFRNLFQQQWASDSIAYYGNPMDGLQIMGLLETRLLDFKTIFVLGMNEGKMPPSNPIQTMVPMDLRRYLGMPTPREKQGLFAHHFYRLLHQCERMVITYAEVTNGQFSSEQSRYLMQLELELARKNTHLIFTKKTYSLGREDVKTSEVSIPKTAELETRLDQLFAQRTSASALKTFIQCPLDFYYKYVLKFGEEKKVEEDLEQSTLGTFIHEVLEKMYEPFSKRDKKGELKTTVVRALQVEDVNEMIKNAELELRRVFSTHFHGHPEAFEVGKNYLNFSMANELLTQFLRQEKQFLLENPETPLYIEALEQELTHTLQLEIFGKTREITLLGFIDRIDSVGGKIRIIDYKTGKVKEEDTGKANNNTAKMEPVDLLVKLSKESKHFLQLMIYNFLYLEKQGKAPDSSCIISFVNTKKGPFGLHADTLSPTMLAHYFPEVLRHLLAEIYDPETPFEHAKQLFSYCLYCQ